MVLRVFCLSIGLFFAGFVLNMNAAIFVVDRADDVAGATACTAAANDCSLRGAIINSNANGAGADIIQFNVGGGNFQTITMSSTAMPDIQTSLTVDGTTQPLFGGLPLIEINGAASVAGTNGFKITSPVGNIPITVTIKSLVINRFKSNGIFFSASSGVTATVVGSYIGVDGGGSIDRGNSENGIRINAFPNSVFTIGGTATSERNLISGNDQDGINVVAASGLFSADTTFTVLNNFIGTSSGGNIDLGNSFNGISFGGGVPSFGYSMQIGNGLANGRNIISGNDKIGIFATTGTLTVSGNYIGTSFNGNVDVGNTLDGIQLAGNVVSATIGGTVIGIPVGNVISGNDRKGIWINSASIPATIRGNKIGTNAAGTSALGNSSDGIYLYENDTATNSNIVIGSDTEPLDGNTISGNLDDGIEVDEKVNKVKIYGNRIGTNNAATAAIPNANVGIRLLSASNAVGMSSNNIASNVISGNNGAGVLIVTPTAMSNRIYNNYIGTNASGGTLGNSADGIYINQNASFTEIGDGTAGAGNKIAFNAGNGVNVADGQNNIISVNSIYSNSALGIDLGADGVTPNDLGDDDTGANGLQNFPVIERATPTRITATLNSLNNNIYNVEYFRVDSCDNSGYGEGRYYLGTRNFVAPNASGNADASFAVNLSAGQFVTATATGIGIFATATSEFSQCVAVTPEPGNLSFSASSYTANEAAGSRTIVVNRTGGSFGTILVNYATSNGTATAGQDYAAQSGTLTFLNGETVKTFDIPINDDLLDEADETVNITLSNASPGVFLTPNATAILTIIDNDPPPIITIIDISSFEGNIGNAQFSFRVSLSAPSGLPITIDYATANGTATENSDYLPTNGTLNFAPGETVKNVVVTVLGDLTPELDETFFVNLSNPTNSGFGDDQGLGTIKDDDNPGKFKFAFAPYSGTEHDSVLVTVQRTNGTAGTVSVDYATGGGTSTPFVDYTPVSGTLIFGDGETTKTFFVTLLDDLIAEPTETVNLVLSNPIGGAVLGAPSVAVLTIFDNDNGTLLNLAGEVVSSFDHSPISNVTMALQGTQNAVATTDSLGKYSFPNLAPNGNYTVTPAAIGYTFNPINQQFNNLTTDNLDVNFTATAAPSRQIRVVGGNAVPGQDVQVNIELVAQGDENSAGFSLNYDPLILTNPSAVLGADALTGFLTVNNSTSGKLGILLALPAGQNFAVGTKQIVTITFNTMPTNLYNSPVTFGNIPIVQQIVNTNADALPTNYLDGAVTFAQGFEADVAPRPTGNNNGTITIADFTQVGRFVAGLDNLNPNFNEFQRADSAPRVTLGNGVLTVSDYTQAGRYAAGLDIVNPVGGAYSANFAPDFIDAKEIDNLLAVPTVVRVVNAQGSAGNQVVVSIEAVADGMENGFGFSVNYDQTKLSNPSVAKGVDTQSATLIPNTNTAGKIGVVLAMPFGQAVPAGTRQIVTITLNVAANTGAGITPLTFGDMPTFREVSDINANVLMSSFEDGQINILGPTAANVAVGGRVLNTNGQPIARAQVSIIDQYGATRTAMTNPFGFYRFENIAIGESYLFSARHKLYQFESRVIVVLDELGDLNFVAPDNP